MTDCCEVERSVLNTINEDVMLCHTPTPSLAFDCHCFCHFPVKSQYLLVFPQKNGLEFCTGTGRMPTYPNIQQPGSYLITQVTSGRVKAYVLKTCPDRALRNSCLWTWVTQHSWLTCQMVMMGVDNSNSTDVPVLKAQVDGLDLSKQASTCCDYVTPLMR